MPPPFQILIRLFLLFLLQTFLLLPTLSLLNNVLPPLTPSTASLYLTYLTTHLPPPTPDLPILSTLYHPLHGLSPKISYNKVESTIPRSPQLHSEIVLLTEKYPFPVNPERHDFNCLYENTTIIVNHEPCKMCYEFIKKSGVKRVVFWGKDTLNGGVTSLRHEEKLERIEEDKVKVYEDDGVEIWECEYPMEDMNVLQEYFRERRKGGWRERKILK